MKVLIIEDNERLAASIKQKLRKWFTIDIAVTGRDGIDAASSGAYDILLLDLGLPDMTGVEVCRQLRKASASLPILVLTGANTTDSQVQLFEMGADDYVLKPFNIDTLRARINALARRRSRIDIPAIIELGDLTIDPSRRIVTRSGIQIDLRRKEYDILEYLVSNPGRIMTREMIVNHAWDSSTGATWTGSVDVHIKQLRDKVDKPFAYPLIKTSYGVGYIADLPDEIKKASGVVSNERLSTRSL
jgi:two-component system copper resistance phosphate regulon response regulator CusR